MPGAHKPGDGHPPTGITQQLAHHDAAISALGGRMTGVESGLKTLQGEVHQGFAGMGQTLTSLNSKFDTLAARPTFDVHKTIGTVVSLAVLFSMVVGGIIWVTTSQFSGVVAEQKSFNQTVTKTLERHDQQIETLGKWITTTTTPRTSR